MSAADGGAWVEYLGEDECWRLLALQPVGRVGVLVDSAPEIYPVNHMALGRSIVFRTDPGNKLSGLDRSPSVCFEVDELDVETRTGWSVLVKGRASQITDPGEIDPGPEAPLRLWVIGARAHWVRIVPDEVTGRRIHRFG